jgi:hypothetical protein
MKIKQYVLVCKAILLIAFTAACQEKKQGFPAVEYAEAKVYYFNTQEEKYRPISAIYTPESGLAENAIDAEVTLSQSSLVTILAEVNKGLEGLVMGTSGCFIPRHGIVFYASNGEVVAAMSICFECESVRFWDIKKGNYPSKVKKVNTKLIESQLKNIKDELTSGGVKVYTNPEEYAHISVQKNNDIVTQSTQKTMAIQDNQYVTKVIGNGYQNELLTWFDACKDVFVSEDVKYTAGGDKYIFMTIRSQNSTVLFSKESNDWVMGDGIIKDACVRLPNGIQVGDALSNVLASFSVYDGISSPDVITVIGEKFQIVYSFEFEKLVSITIGLS